MRQDLVRVRRLRLPLQGTVGHSRAQSGTRLPRHDKDRTRTGQGPDKDKDKDEDEDKDKDKEPR